LSLCYYYHLVFLQEIFNLKYWLERVKHLQWGK